MTLLSSLKKLTIGNFMTFHADSLASIFLKMRHKEHKETTKCELRIKLHFHDDASSIFFFILESVLESVYRK